MVRRSVVNTKAMKCRGQVNTRRVAAILFILQEVLFLFFFWLGAAWVKSRAERPSVSGVN